MYKVYLLQSLTKPTKTYVDITTIKDVKVRLNEHNNELSTYTKTDRPWKVVYHEIFYCRLCAEKREKFLKSGFGNRLKKVIVENAELLSGSALQDGV